MKVINSKVSADARMNQYFASAFLLSLTGILLSYRTDIGAISAVVAISIMIMMTKNGGRIEISDEVIKLNRINGFRVYEIPWSSIERIEKNWKIALHFTPKGMISGRHSHWEYKINLKTGKIHTVYDNFGESLENEIRKKCNSVRITFDVNSTI